MKRIVFIACLLLSCLAVRALIPITHDFTTDAGTKLTWRNSVYTVGYYDEDGVVYTCTNATFTTSGSPATFYINMSYNGIVEVSQISGLRSFTIQHNTVPDGIGMNILISTDGAKWSLIPEAQLSRQNSYIEATGLNGDYYIKLQNTHGSAVRILQLNYQTEPEPESCRCLRVVVN